MGFLAGTGSVGAVGLRSKMACLGDDSASYCLILCSSTVAEFKARFSGKTLAMQLDLLAM